MQASERYEVHGALEQETEDGDARRAMLRALTKLVARTVRRRALLIAIDDVDRCDEGSLAHIRVCLAACRAGEHAVWPWAAGCEVECTEQVEGLEAAHRVGLPRVAEAEAAGLHVMREHIEIFVALIEGRMGQLDAAVRRLDAGIAHRERHGMRGLNLGWSHEARAYVAVWMGDREAFERHLLRCAASYRGGQDNPALAARYQRLLQEGRTRWAGVRDAMVGFDPLDPIDPSAGYSTGPTTVLQEMADAAGPAARAQVALAELLRAAGQAEGQLYLLGPEGLLLMASAGDDDQDHSGPIEPQPQLQLGGDDGDDELATVTGDSEMQTGKGTASAILLTCPEEDGMAAVGALFLPNLSGTAEPAFRRAAGPSVAPCSTWATPAPGSCFGASSAPG